MKPTRQTTRGEYRVIGWTFACAFAVAAVAIGSLWLTRTQACCDACLSKGFGDGTLRFNSGSRLNIGTYCECSDALSRPLHDPMGP